MKLKKETDYALRIIYYLLKNNHKPIIDSKTISKNENIPENFAIKILKKLAKHKIINSHRGVSGGFSLNKKSENIFLGEIIKITEGPIEIRNYNSIFENSIGNLCPVETSLIYIEKALLRDLDHISFEDIINKKIS